MLVDGGIVFTTVERVAGLGRYHLLASGMALVAVVVVAPEGIVGTSRRLLGRRTGRHR
jgi:ABC-type branched-subunit amino acid transport system permease subunit